MKIPQVKLDIIKTITYNAHRFQSQNKNQTGIKLPRISHQFSYRNFNIELGGKTYSIKETSIPTNSIVVQY